ncbi:sensor histidine kinase [Gracilibacillus dipsosauri]|nr:sensor histidine kinase [Gracilibacillus dipsosauri]
MVNFRRLASPSFRSKVFFASFLCIGIPVLVCLSFYTYLTRDAVEEQAIMNAKKEINLVNENVTKILEDLMNVSNFVQIDTEINAVLKSKARDGSGEDSHTYEAYMEDRLVRKTIENITQLGEKSYVTILLTNGKYYTNYSVTEYNPMEIFKKDWFEDLQQIRGYQSLWVGVESTEFAYDQLNHPFQLSVARTLRDTNQQIYGYVVVTLLETKIRNILQNKNNQEQILLVDQNQTILSTQNADQIGEKLEIREQLTNKDTSTIIDWKEKKHLLTTKKLSFNGWSLVSIIPYKQATSNINAVFSKVFSFLSISFAIFFVLLAFLMKRITKPLGHLDKVVKQVQTGDLTVRAEVKSHDEIGKFSRSLNQMIERINGMIEEVRNTQRRKRQAELAMLQAQINPHFLFNVLNSIRMKVLKFGDKDSAIMIQSLSKLLRGTIDNNHDMITVADEISLISDYVHLMNMRQKHKVNLLKEMDQPSTEVMIPRFILQPLIENAIIHGFHQSNGRILLKTRVEEGELEILIQDNGIGMDPETLEKVQKSFIKPKVKYKSNKGLSSIGLANVYERLHLTFPLRPSMEIRSQIGEGTTISIKIPLEGDGIVQGDVS